MYISIYTFQGSDIHNSKKTAKMTNIFFYLFPQFSDNHMPKIVAALLLYKEKLFFCLFSLLINVLLGQCWVTNSPNSNIQLGKGGGAWRRYRYFIAFLLFCQTFMAIYDKDCSLAPHTDRDHFININKQI